MTWFLLCVSVAVIILLKMFGNTIFGLLPSYRRLTKYLFGWDWMWVHWGGDWYVRVLKFTNIGEAYVTVLSDRMFINDERYHQMKGDTFEWPVKENS